jgi:hypothetical protein
MKSRPGVREDVWHLGIGTRLPQVPLAGDQHPPVNLASRSPLRNFKPSAWSFRPFIWASALISGYNWSGLY